MTYPPKDYYKKDMKRTKSVIFSKYFLVALIVTITIYFLIDKILQWLR